MSATTAPTTTDAPGGAGAGDTDAPGGAARVARYLGVPAALAATCLALYLWVTRNELDSIEARLLTPERLTTEILQHLLLTALATIAVLAIAVPLGIVLTRPSTRRLRGPALAIANAGQAIPSIGLLVLLAVAFLLLGTFPVVIGLVAYAVLPVLRNTMVGIDEVDETVIDAARGMGLSRWQVLWRVEFPLAVPVMAAGIRTALVLVVGSAALATFIDGGGLGAFINAGVQLQRNTVLYTGAILTAVLALLVDWIGSLVEDALRPKGLS